MKDTRSRRALLTASLALLGLLGLTALIGNPITEALVGRDSLSFAWTDGARGTLTVAGVVLVVAFGVGTVAGSTAALGPPLADAFLSRAMEIGGALPSVAAVIVLHALEPAPNLVAVGTVLAVLRGLGTAKTVRADVLQLMASDFVLAARALGSGRIRIFRVHLFPHVAGPAIASATVTAAAVIGLDAALSFLGFSNDGSSWGAFLAQAARHSNVALAVGPGLGVLATVLSLHVVADALEERFGLGRRFM